MFTGFFPLLVTVFQRIQKSLRSHWDEGSPVIPQTVGLPVTLKSVVFGVANDPTCRFHKSPPSALLATLKRFGLYSRCLAAGTVCAFVSQWGPVSLLAWQMMNETHGAANLLRTCGLLEGISVGRRVAVCQRSACVAVRGCSVSQGGGA